MIKTPTYLILVKFKYFNILIHKLIYWTIVHQKYFYPIKNIKMFSELYNWI